MTEKQIEKKAKEMAIKLEGEIGTSPHSRQAIEESMLEMAAFSLSHQWVSVEDELPPVGEWVLIHFLAEYGKSETFACFDGKYWVYDMGREVTITHWMPIPPMEEGGGK